MLEDIRAEQYADEHAADAVAIVRPHRGREEAVVSACDGHDDVAAEDVGLHQRHVFLLALRRGEEIEHHGRSLHAEESAHHAAERSRPEHIGQGGGDMDAPAEEGEPYSRDDEHHAQNVPQQPVVHLLQTEDRRNGDDGEGGEDGQQLAPLYVAPHLPRDGCRCCQGQESRQGGGFSVGGHEQGQHRHDEDAEPEADGALDEARDDREKEDVDG